jgi:O-antigen/teichoic acid export membrane protein
VLIRNIFSNWASVAINLAVAFLLSPFLVHSLGDSAYGLWVLVLSVTGYMGLLDTGLRVSIVKHTAECNARGDTEELNRVLHTGLTLYGSLSLIVVLLSFVASMYFDSIFTVPATDVSTGRLLVIIAGINVALSLPLGVLGGLLAGLQRYDLLNVASVIVLLARTALVVAAVSTGFGVVALGWIHVASQVLTAVVFQRLAKLQIPALDLGFHRFREFNRATMRGLYAYSGYIVLNNVAMFLMFYSGEVLIGMFIGTAAVTSYAIARSLVQYLSTIVGSMTQVFHPYASDQHERGNSAALRDVLVVGTKTSLLITLPVGVALLIVGPAFIGLWMGPQYGRSAGMMLAVLTLAQVVWLSQSTAGNVLLGIGKHRVIAIGTLAAGVGAIVASLALVPAFGSEGVAAGPLLPILVWAGVLPVTTARAVNMTLGDYFKHAYAGPLAAVVPFAAVLFWVSRTWPASNLLTFALQVTICLTTFVPAAYFLAFGQVERQRWIARVRAMRQVPEPASVGPRDVIR